MKLGFAVALTAAAIAVPTIGLCAQEQRVALTPVAAQSALDEFIRVCLRNFPSAAKVRSAVGRSSSSYAAAVAPQGEQWRSRQAVVGLVTHNNQATRCEFDAMLTDKVVPGSLASIVQRRLEQELGARPPHRQLGQAIMWEWSVGGVTHSLTVDFTGADRQLALSLAQRVGA